jgi:hypothetical protein
MSSEVEKIKSAGDFQLIDVKIGSVKGTIFDVFNFVIDINIYEDMYSPTMSGNITLNDAQDLVNLMPMIGEEKLLITFKTPSIDEKDGLYEQEFYIYKMTDRKYTAERAVEYTLHFVSFETVRDLNAKVSKGFAGTISTVVEQILKQELRTDKKINIEKTKNTTMYVSNFWTPFTNINFLAKRSLSQETESANFIFFENNRGFNYASIDTLLSQDPKTKYIYDNNSRDPSADGGGSSRDIAETLSRINSVKINTAFDYMNRIQSGMYKSRLITHEIVTKTYNVQTLTYEDEFKNHNHLNKYPLSTVNLPSKTFAFLDVKPRALENFSNFKTDKMKTWYLKNIMHMNEINAYYMDITVPGRSDLCVGDVVDVYMYRPTPFNQKDQEEQLLDKTFSGRYMIASLCHNLNREKHEIHMSIIKDSLIVDLTKEGSE